MAVIFPVFLGGALVVKEEGTAFQSVVLVSPMLLVLRTLTFGHFYWVTRRAFAGKRLP